MQINEPTTVVTDIILGGQTLLYAILLQRGNTTGQRSVRSWSAMMAAVSVAAFAGAVSHALYYDSAVNWVGWLRNAAWKLVGLSTAVGSGLMLVAVIFNTIPTGRRALFIIAAGAKSVIFAVVAWFSGNYLYTIIDYGLSMLIVLAVQIRQWRSAAAAPWLAAGIIVSLVAAGLQRSGITLHKNFNYNDIYHLVQIAAFHLLYEGARRTHDLPESRG